MIALALLADATGSAAETTTFALVVLPVVFLLGIAAYARLVQINAEEFQLVLAMNRLRHAYLTLEPGLERYLSTGHHDDQQGVFATYMVGRPGPAVAVAPTSAWSTRRTSSRRWMRHWLRPVVVLLGLHAAEQHPRPWQWPARWRRSCWSGSPCSCFSGRP